MRKLFRNEHNLKRLRQIGIDPKALRPFEKLSAKKRATLKEMGVEARSPIARPRRRANTPSRTTRTRPRQSISFDRWTCHWHIAPGFSHPSGVVVSVRTNLERWPRFGERPEHPENFQSRDLLAIASIFPMLGWFQAWGRWEDSVRIMEEIMEEQGDRDPERLR